MKGVHKSDCNCPICCYGRGEKPKKHKSSCSCFICKAKRKESVPWNKGLHGEEFLSHFKSGNVWNKGLKGEVYKKHYKRETKCHGGCGKTVVDKLFCEICSKKFAASGGNAFVRKHGGWSNYHEVFKRENFNKYKTQICESGSKGGKVTAEKYGGWAWVDCSESGRKAVERNRKNKTGPFFDPVLRRISESNGGKASTAKHGGWAWIDHRENGLKAIERQRENRPHYFLNISHASNEEKNVSKILHGVGMPLIVGETVHVRIGNKEIDWRVRGLDKFDIKDGTFIEYHPCPQYRDERTYEEYYKQRQEILDDNGYKDDLIVFTSVSEVKMVFNGTKQKEMESK